MIGANTHTLTQTDNSESVSMLYYPNYILDKKQNLLTSWKTYKSLFCGLLEIYNTMPDI